MFTGIITHIGQLAAIARSGDGARLKVKSAIDPATIDLGASIACSGVCLTVTEKGGGDTGWFAADVSNETLGLTTIGDWREGDEINLERALKIGDELGGHLVTGHVDGIARITDIADDGASKRFTVEAPGAHARFIAPKGAVTLDGVSLTVNEVEGARFGVNIIPHTAEVTNWRHKTRGDAVNLEIDLMARYAARLGEFSARER